MIDVKWMEKNPCFTCANITAHILNRSLEFNIQGQTLVLGMHNAIYIPHLPAAFALLQGACNAQDSLASCTEDVAFHTSFKN